MSPLSRDQASGLRRLFRQAPPEVLSIVPCGAGATAWTARQIVQRGRAGRRVLALDEWSSSGSLADRLGIRPHYDLLHAVEGLQNIESCLSEISPEVFIAPVAQLVLAMSGDRVTLQRTADCLHRLQPVTDEWIVLTRPSERNGLSPLAMAAPRMLLVLDAHPKAMTEAYATLKGMRRGVGTSAVALVLAGPHTPEAGGLLANLQQAARQHLGIALQSVRNVGEAFGIPAQADARELSEVFIERLVRLSREAVASKKPRGLVA